MGILRDSIKAVLPQRQQTAIAATLPVGVAGVPQLPPHSYERNAREGYMRDELVYACVELLAASAAEPRLALYRGERRIERHPLLDLWARPNPFLDHFTLVASLIMYREIGGNAYIEKVRSRAGKVVELWLMRPDRVRVIPDADRFIGGYQYQVGALTHRLAPEDVVHFKTRHPLDDYYGLPTLAPLARRVDLDSWATDFVRAFFSNAGVPAGLLNIQRAASQQEREMIRTRFRQEYGGPSGWHNLMVIDGGQADYKPMGLPLGPRGTAVGELDEMNEARICMGFGIPPSLIGTRLGMQTGSYANRRQDQTNLWEQTLVPLYREMGAVITAGLASEYPDVDRAELDLSTVQALSEDVDLLHARIRADVEAGIMTREEARCKLGLQEKADPNGTYLLPIRIVPRPTDEAPVAEPVALPPPRVPGEGPAGTPDAIAADEAPTEGTKNTRSANGRR